MDSERYTVKIVFRGLCLARKNREQERLDFFLPEASEVPPPSAEAAAANPCDGLLHKFGPYREHHAVLEFPQADWENISAITPRLLQVVKPTKEPVALYLLRRQRINFGGLYRSEAARPRRPQILMADADLYTQLGRILLLSKHDEHGFDQLPGFLGELVDDETARKASAAVVSLHVGEAFTERRSQHGGKDLAWREVRPRQPGDAAPARVLNLDIAVRFTLPAWNPLRITCEPLSGRIEGDERTFLLRPRDLSKGLTVWVKNRELSAILLDSDALPDPYESDCPHRGDLDRDHLLLFHLARFPENLTVPQRASGNASNCGSGCGCSENRP